MVVGIRCSGAISGERERLTWEALLLTPLETRYLVRGKLRGIMVDVSEKKRVEEERQEHVRFLESLDRVNRAIRLRQDLSSE